MCWYACARLNFKGDVRVAFIMNNSLLYICRLDNFIENSCRFFISVISITKNLCAKLYQARHLQARCYRGQCVPPPPSINLIFREFLFCFLKFTCKEIKFVLNVLDLISPLVLKVIRIIDGSLLDWRSVLIALKMCIYYYRRIPKLY